MLILLISIIVVCIYLFSNDKTKLSLNNNINEERTLIENSSLNEMDEKSTILVHSEHKNWLKLHSFEKVTIPIPFHHLNHTIVISIKQNNISYLTDLLLNEISNPDSNKYGKYLSFENIGEIIVNKEGSDIVQKWLNSLGVNVKNSSYGEFLDATTTVENWKKIFNTTFHYYDRIHSFEKNLNQEYEIDKDGNTITIGNNDTIIKERVIRSKHFWIPKHIKKHIHSLYEVSNNASSTFSSLSDNVAIDEIKNIETNFPDSIPSGIKYKDKIPSKLRGRPQDQIYNARMIEKNKSNFKKRLSKNVREFPRDIRANSKSSQGIMTPKKLREIYRISGEGSKTRGNQSIFASLNQYFSIQDLAKFQKRNDLEDDPLTVNSEGKPAGIGGHIDLSNRCISNPSDCAEVSLDVQYIKAISTNTPTYIWYVDENSDTFINWIRQVHSCVNPPLVHSISYGSYEKGVSDNLRNAFNTEAIKLSLRGITIVASSGDDGVSGFLHAKVGCGYFAQFPASSPYVTSVGATMGPEDNNNEMVCQSNKGSKITSGGGFSNVWSRPQYQNEAVQDFLNLNQGGSITNDVGGNYNTGFRGYPDLSMLGNKFEVVIGGKIFLVSGSSASAPVFAGMISLINTIRLNNKMSPVGFANPVLYQFRNRIANDIVEGDNKCTADPSKCCPQGFHATQGWDPASGIGSVDFANLLQLYSTSVPGR